MSVSSAVSTDMFLTLSTACLYLPCIRDFPQVRNELQPEDQIICQHNVLTALLLSEATCSVP